MGEEFEAGLRPKTAKASVDGMQMAYLVWGGGPRDVVLIHGLSSQARTWWRVAPALVQAGYRVVAPDLPGHGDSTQPADDYKIGHTAEAVDALLVTLGLHAPVIAGHSWGGAVALVHATGDSRVKPSRVLLLDPLLRMAPGADSFAAGLAKLCGQPRRDLAMTLRELYPRWHDGDVFWKAEALEKALPSAVLGLISDNPELDLTARLLQLHVPWTIIAADAYCGGIIPPEMHAEIETAARAKGGRVEYMPGIPHDIYREDFAATMHLMRLN